MPLPSRYGQYAANLRARRSSPPNWRSLSRSDQLTHIDPASKAEGRRFDPAPGHQFDQHVPAGQGHIEIELSRAVHHMVDRGGPAKSFV
jgi:hypothetical protein